jgi:hypothetical protein
VTFLGFTTTTTTATFGTTPITTILVTKADATLPGVGGA